MAQELSRKAFELCRKQKAPRLRAFLEAHPDVDRYIFLHEQSVNSTSAVYGEQFYCNIMSLAAYQQSPKCLQVLLDFGVDVNKQDVRWGWNAFMASSASGSVKCMRLLLKNNVDMGRIDAEGRAGVAHAAWKGQHKCLQLIIDAKADVNQQTMTGNTGLHLASRDGHVECLRLLLDSKADVNLQDNKNQTGILFAAWKERTECLKVLIEAKADVDYQTNEGVTGLHTACHCGSAESLSLLLESNADVQLQDNDGRTGLMICSWKGRPECLKLLIDGKADVNRQTHHEVDALGATLVARHLSCTLLLLDHPSDTPASDQVKADALLEALGPHQGSTAQAQTAAFALLACGAATGKVGKSKIPRDHLLTARTLYRKVMGFVDKWHGVAVAALSNLVEVDTRVGRGDYGIYQEPLERVLQYLGLSMTVNQVVNTDVDSKSTRRALIPMQARCANQWHELFKRTH